MMKQPPIAGIDHQIADAPGLVIDDEVVHVADRVVAPLNVVTSDFLGAAQMHVATDLARTVQRQVVPRLAREQTRIHTHTPGIRVPPVDGVLIVAGIGMLVLAGHRLVRIDARAVLDLVHRQSQMEATSRPLDIAERDWRDQHLTSIEKSSSFDDEVAYRPVLVIQQEIRKVSDVTIAGALQAPIVGNPLGNGAIDTRVFRAAPPPPTQSAVEVAKAAAAEAAAAAKRASDKVTNDLLANQSKPEPVTPSSPPACAIPATWSTRP